METSQTSTDNVIMLNSKPRVVVMDLGCTTSFGFTMCGPGGLDTAHLTLSIVAILSLCTVYIYIIIIVKLNKKDFVTRCKAMNIDDDTLIRARNDLLILLTTQVSGLVDKRALPVTRRERNLHPLLKKLIEDIWYLADCISSKRNVKRLMYKSGKRSAEYLADKLVNNIAPPSQFPTFSPQDMSHSPEG